MHCNSREPCPLLGPGLLPEMRIGITLNLDLSHTLLVNSREPYLWSVPNPVSGQVEAAEKPSSSSPFMF